MLDAIATAILAGMMFLPIINLVVGIIAGTALFGVAGGFAGAALGVLITIAAFNRAVPAVDRCQDAPYVGTPTAAGELVAALASLILHRGPETERGETDV